MTMRTCPQHVTGNLPRDIDRSLAVTWCRRLTISSILVNQAMTVVSGRTWAWTAAVPQDGPRGANLWTGGSPAGHCAAVVPGRTVVLRIRPDLSEWQAALLRWEGPAVPLSGNPVLTCGIKPPTCAGRKVEGSSGARYQVNGQWRVAPLSLRRSSRTQPFVGLVPPVPK
jgi:hypothetical protein